jgi:hypothetical protein
MRVYSNLAVQTSLTSSATNIASTLSVGSTAGWPVPTGGNVAVAAINYGNPTLVEIVTYNGLTSTSLTGVTRGVDDTDPRSHSSGALVVHVASAKDIEKIDSHTHDSVALGTNIGLVLIETTTGNWSGDAPVRTTGVNPIEFRGWSDPAGSNGINTPANIRNGDIWTVVTAP